MIRGLITVPEAAQLKGVTRSAIYKAIERGDLETQKILGKMAVRQKDVLNWEPRKAGRHKGTATTEEVKGKISAAQKARWEKVRRENRN